MSKTMKRIWAVLVALSLLFAIVMPPGAAMAEESNKADFELKAVEKDGELRVKVLGKQLTDVYAFELQFEYDPLRFQLTGADTAIRGFSIEPIIRGNRILFAHTKVGSEAGITGDSELAELIFKRIRGGDAGVGLTVAKLVDSPLDQLTVNREDHVVSSDGQERVKLADIAGHWAEGRIDTAVELGFVSGYEDGTFRPDNPITRAEFSVLLAQALLLTDAAKLFFADAEQIPVWARAAVASMVESGIIQGYEDGSFRADRLINRSEIAVMVVRALGAQVAAGTEPDFADAGLVPDWAKPSVKLAADRGIVQGREDNQFAPLAQATRAEAVTLVLSLLQEKVEGAVLRF